jgi:iron complex outermembrane receptor protein
MREVASKWYCLAVLLPAVAAGQQATPDPDSGAQLNEVVITARKTSEDLQKAPIAVTTVSSEEIARSGIKDPTDLQWQLPALEFQVAQSVPDVFIRGVGTYDLQAGVDSAVAYSIDGIYLAHPSAYPPVLVDIAQVEEVRGPQGTLYGRNSNGGAIIFNSNKPVIGNWDAEAGISTGNYGQLGSDFMVNVPLGDTLATRFAFGTDRHDPYFANGAVNANNFTGRWRTLFQPLDNLEIIATLDRSRISNNDAWVPDVCAPRSDSPQCAGVPFRPWTGIGPRNPTDFDHINTWGAYIEANLKLSWATITSLTGYRNSDWKSQITWATGGIPYGYTPQGALLPGETNTGFTQGQDSRNTTQELRIASPSDSSSPLSWLLGLYYSRERAPYAETLINNNAAFFTTTPLLADDSKAVFGQLTYSIITGLRVTGGLRYTNEDKSAAQTENGVAVNPTDKLSKVTWKGGLDYDLSPTSLLYGSVSTGFKSGGVSEVPNFPGSSQTYGPETITAYQFGNKNRFWSDRVQVNYELFYYDYHGFQTLDGVVDPTGTYQGFFLETLNSQKATMYGGELEAVVALSAHDRLTFTPTVLHAIFNQFDVGGVNNNGHHIQAAAPYTVGGSFQHEFVLPASNKIIAKVSTELVGGHYMDNGNAPGSFQPTYTRTSADLTYEDGGGHWSASAYVRNLENTGAISFYVGSTLGAADTVGVLPPRTYGLSVRWHM